ncbi:MAG: lactate utilization protein, partial [Chloroflexi bacterium]|nr:lactate utilization protein [Chloroflexota bacterium]
RSASLLPTMHIAIIRQEQIVPNFEAWAEQQRADEFEGFRQASNIVAISGASRTADIAMELILGMHGPAELHIVILP